MFGEQFFVNARLIIEALCVGFRSQADQVLISLKVLRQKNQMVVGLFARCPSRSVFSAATRDVSLTTYDGFHAVALHGIVEGYRTIHVAMIRHGTRLHF